MEETAMQITIFESLNPCKVAVFHINVQHVVTFDRDIVDNHICIKNVYITILLVLQWIIILILILLQSAICSAAGSHCLAIIGYTIDKWLNLDAYHWESLWINFLMIKNIPKTNVFHVLIASSILWIHLQTEYEVLNMMISPT